MSRSRIAAAASRSTICASRIEAAASPLPVEFLAALSTAGDASCLEAIAAAYVRATAAVSANQEQGDWWRDHLAEAFSLIVGREGLTRRHAQVKKIEKRWGAALEALGGEGRRGGEGGGAGAAPYPLRLGIVIAVGWSRRAGSDDGFQSDVEVHVPSPRP